MEKITSRTNTILTDYELAKHIIRWAEDTVLKYPDTLRVPDAPPTLYRVESTVVQQQNGPDRDEGPVYLNSFHVSRLV